jgi:hypothetical protein
MARDQSAGVCDICRGGFGYYLIHNGFNDSNYAYCDGCGCTALLSGYSSKIPSGASRLLVGYERINPVIEAFLRPCECGGHFTSTAGPRCPRCSIELSAESATDFIERNAPGTAGGWRWQRNWSGLYAIVIDERFVRDPWIDGDD